MPPTGLPAVYLDTNIFQPVVYRSERFADAQFAHCIRDNLRGDVSNEEIDVKIPKPAIGELVSDFRDDVVGPGVAEVGCWRPLLTTCQISSCS